MAEPETDRAHLRDLYGNADKLRIRHEAHARFSENRGRFFDWLLPFLEPLPDLVLLDVGCGHGAQHPRLRQQRMRILGVDASPGMCREVRDQARSLQLPVAPLRGDAETLPLADASCDRVLANHVLFHVPDRRRALAEIRRVLRPGGRAVLTTNAVDSGRRLFELHEQVAHDLGYRPAPPLYERFHLGHLALVQEVFPDARLRVRDDAFRFPDIEVTIAYYCAAMIDRIDPLPADGSHRTRLVQMMAPEIEKVIATEGVFRIPKVAGCFVATA